jgi:Rha family phage regulatory protein
MISELVKRRNGKAMASSLKVAGVFNLPHEYVEKSIRNLKCSEEFREANIVRHFCYDYRDKSYPMFYLTKNGFAMLMELFRHEQDFLSKESFLSAFDKAEQEINTD